MSGATDPSLRGLNDCGCCAGVALATPARVWNRDGLGRLAARVGTHAQFKQSMLAALSTARHLPLRQLLTRDDDDFSVALLDSWATVADVITFYQERLLNEAYLRTATERRSILELARAIGYELDPGVAAATWLAFTAEASVENETRIPVGTKVQSVPGQDEKPQTFETVEEIKARPEWNELRACSRVTWNPQAGERKGWLQGTATNLHPGDILLLVRLDPALSPYWLWESPVLLTVTADPKLNLTEVTWRDGLQWRRGGAERPPAQQSAIDATLLAAGCQLCALRRKANVFGVNAANWRQLSDNARQDYLGHAADDWEKAEWPGYEIYAPQRTSPDQPPRQQLIYPTPEEIAQAARDSARGVARAAEKEMPQAVSSSIGAAGAVVQSAGAKAIKAMEDAYDPPGTALKAVVDALVDIIGKFGVQFPDLSMGNIVTGGVFPGLNIDLDPTKLVINVLGAAFGALTGSASKNGNPINITSQPDLTGAFSNLVSAFQNVGFSLGNLGNSPAQIAENLTALIKNNPAFLPLNTLEQFGKLLVTSPNSAGADAGLITNARDSVAKVIEAAVTVATTKAAAEAVGAAMKVALEPHDPLPPATPESVALVARVTVKVGKYAALVATLPLAATNANLLTTFQAQGARFSASSDPFFAIQYIYDRLDSDFLPALLSAAGGGDLAGEFQNPDAEDRMAIAIVLGCIAFGVVAAGTAVAAGAILIAGGTVMAATALATGLTLPLLAAAVADPILLMAFVQLTAPGVVVGLVSIAAGAAVLTAVATTLEIAQLTIASGPIILRAVLRTEHAVLLAVKNALAPRHVPRPPRLLAARDYQSVDLDAPYSAAVPGGWFLLLAQGNHALFQIDQAEDVARAEFQQSLRVTRMKLKGAGLAGPFQLTRNDVDQLVTQGLLADGAALLRNLAGQHWADAQGLIDAMTAAGGAGSGAIRQIAPHLRDLLVMANRGAFARVVRDASVHLESVPLQAGLRPVTRPVAGNTVELDRGVTDLPRERKLIITGTVAGGQAGAGQLQVETVLLKAMGSPANGRSQLVLNSPGLLFAYDPATVSILANVAPATHGETINEVLGDGDASRDFQQFTLKQVPLTFTRDSSIRGSASTLTVWVNDIQWTEVPNFFDRRPDERIFVTRRADDGTVTVIFGNGRSGARLPTGTGNIRVVYRKGTGIAGMVRAGQLKTLLSRPLGVRDAVNRLPALGGDDPEPRDEARRNAPLTVRTLDRVVSLEDYEDFTRTYPGVTKVLATWIWTGRVRGILLTIAIATPEGAAATLPDDFRRDLIGALRAAGDPYVPVEIKLYRPATFALRGTLTVKAEYAAAKVLAQARQALLDAYSFAAREFGQPVALSEILATLHGVAGVQAVDLDHLQRTDRIVTEDPAPRLLADLPVGGVEQGVPAAELLTLLDASVADLTLAS